MYTHTHTHTHMVYECEADLDLSGDAVSRCDLVALRAPKSFSPAFSYDIGGVCGITGCTVRSTI